MRVALDGDRCNVIGRGPGGFRILAGFVDQAEQREIVEWIHEHVPWDQRRQGALPASEEYPYDRPIPLWAEALAVRMRDMALFAEVPNHVLVRWYPCGSGVNAHIDRGMYGPVVAGLTLASPRMFELTQKRRRSRLEALLLPGDLYVLSRAARHRWDHSIPFRTSDEFRGAVYQRSDGFSVTWRARPRR
jgi:alkylated DNA repair dioxygenase AlkB